MSYRRARSAESGQTGDAQGGYEPYADDGTVYVDNNGFLKVKGVTGA
eukprot:SAG22_NODE_395_length_11139_cov_14.562500_12_plen_47_part_00